MKLSLIAFVFVVLPVHAQKTLGHRARFRFACITHLSQLQPEELAKLPSTPAAFCECVNGRHERYAADSFATQSEIVAYLRNVLELYVPAPGPAADRVATEFRDEADMDRQIRSVCASK